MRIKKYRILRRGRAHPARSPAENAILRKGRRRDISHPLPCGRIFRHRQHQHRLCPARCVPGKGRRAAVGVDDLLDDVQTQNVGRILPRPPWHDPKIKAKLSCSYSSFKAQGVA